MLKKGILICISLIALFFGQLIINAIDPNNVLTSSLLYIFGFGLVLVMILQEDKPEQITITETRTGWNSEQVSNLVMSSNQQWMDFTKSIVDRLESSRSDSETKHMSLHKTALQMPLELIQATLRSLHESTRDYIDNKFELLDSKQQTRMLLLISKIDSLSLQAVPAIVEAEYYVIGDNKNVFAVDPDTNTKALLNRTEVEVLASIQNNKPINL